MKTQIGTFSNNSKMRIAGLALLGLLTPAAPFLAAGDGPHDAAHAHAVPAKLVTAVRNATFQYADVNAATAASYQPLFGCVTGPDHGAMGVHYINLSLYGDGAIDESRPEALIYEPSGGGLQLVGVEYIVDSATWLAHHSSPPMLEGQAFQFVSSPNRYGLPAFFELHVWAWRDNPAGAFVDWNNDVSCEGQ
ncbi:MAG TPA: hypothetical protein VKU19_10455 [Bryobacteraceae bacterium]|nr:hypothetical protein [Bryobacteraceae bacterium]